MIKALNFTAMTKYDHEKAQREAIGEALVELMTMDESGVKAYDAILLAIDEWLNHHTEETCKWKRLKDKLIGSRL